MPAVNTEQQARRLHADNACRRLVTQALPSQGQGGDTMLAHLSPQEALALKLTGGVDTRNPVTDIPQFYGSDVGGPDTSDSRREDLVVDEYGLQRLRLADSESGLWPHINY
jgi:hypothetical protein